MIFYIAIHALITGPLYAFFALVDRSQLINPPGGRIGVFDHVPALFCCYLAIMGIAVALSLLVKSHRYWLGALLGIPTFHVACAFLGIMVVLYRGF